MYSAELTTAEDDRYKVTVGYDHDPQSPREWYNIGTIVCWHSRYDLGDEQPSCSPQEWREQMKDKEKEKKKEVQEAIERGEIEEGEIEERELEWMILPVYMLDHSGIRLRTSGFSSRWDSGMLGYIYAEKTASKSDEKLREILEQEVKIYGQYVNGEVYDYQIEEKVKCDECGHVDYEHFDSCCGFYGLKYIKTQIRSCLPEGHKDLVDDLDI